MTDTVSAPTLGREQQAAHDHVLQGANTLITGPAGTGKSVTVKSIVRDLRSAGKRVAVTASTGIAALNVGGATIHSFLGTGIKGNVHELHKQYPDLSQRLDLASQLEDVDTIVLDEISMLTGDYIEMMSRWLGFARQKRHGREMTPFGGVQMVFVGDFLQLPPVQTRQSSIQDLYAFQNRMWQEADITTFVLRENFRQADAEFVTHLLAIREGQVPKQTREFFAPCVNRPLDNPTWLLPRNDAVQERNLAQLKKITGKMRIYNAEYKGSKRHIEALRKNCIAEDVLRLKRDAPIIFLKNDKDLGIVNGMRGVVTKVLPHLIQVRKPSGDVVSLERHRWEWKNSSGQKLATMHQYPVKLAWALTIHKSQGMTLDSVRCDLSNVFESGHAYVALSRARSADGLALAHPLVAAQIRAATVAEQFYRELE